MLPRYKPRVVTERAIYAEIEGRRPDLEREDARAALVAFRRWVETASYMQELLHLAGEHEPGIERIRMLLGSECQVEAHPSGLFGSVVIMPQAGSHGFRVYFGVPSDRSSIRAVYAMRVPSLRDVGPIRSFCAVAAFRRWRASFGGNA